MHFGFYGVVFVVAVKVEIVKYDVFFGGVRGQVCANFTNTTFNVTFGVGFSGQIGGLTCNVFAQIKGFNLGVEIF